MCASVMIKEAYQYRKTVSIAADSGDLEHAGHRRGDERAGRAPA